MMDCESFKALVHEIDRPGCLEAGVLDLVWGHAQSCPRCSRRLARARELSTALGALAKADERKHAPMQVEARLLNAVRAHRKTVRSFRQRKLAWWMAAAAAVAVMVGAGLAWRRMSVSRHAGGSAPAAAAIPVVPNPPQATLAAPDAQAGEVRHSRPSTRTAKRAARTPAPEPVAELAEFLPLPFANDDSPLGTAEVVRIRLSESALGVLGLPVSEDASRQSVTADVVIGEDGVARAIRFISGPVPSEVVQQLQTMEAENKGANP
ncbi:MAG TPA: hypothetical protein VMT20_00055 [Terriglobia bacterium]|nr:hypothetical protein [Terriglobia bacterium]